MHKAKRIHGPSISICHTSSCCIASDMRVDSPGHTGLFGSGSSLDVEKNVVLDMQIIKVSANIVLHVQAKEQIYWFYN